jgi:hypothetical protein
VVKKYSYTLVTQFLWQLYPHGTSCIDAWNRLHDDGVISYDLNNLVVTINEGHPAGQRLVDGLEQFDP